MGREKIGYGVEVEYLPSDAKMGDYPQFKDSFWTMSPEHKHDTIGRIFSLGAAGVRPLTWMLNKFPKMVLQDGYEWKWHENGITMSDQLGLCRVVIPMTGMADNKQVAIHIEGGELGMHHVWADCVQLEMFKKFARKKEFMLILGKSDRHHVDTNGNPVRYCTSLQEKLKGSNIEIYNRLTARMLYDFIADAMKGNINLDQHRNIVCYTGIWGREEINRALQEELHKTTNGAILGDHFIGQASNKYNSNSVVYGGMFTEYHLPINVTLRVEWMPLYDDARLSSDVDPISGHSIKSMRMTFLDLTEIDGEPNVQLVEHKNGLMFNPVAGTIDPYDPTPMGQAAHTDSYFNYVMEENIGIHIRDISRCGELIYAVQ